MRCFAVVAAAFGPWVAAADALTIDTSKVGQTFDGIGGLSGGGATSRLLVDYREPQRAQILDYLFTPNYGASLQILKVEIGGDSQSTDGTESSHMHSADDLDYNRGYEWWLLKEAKKRNPDIKTYGLPWAYPGWVGGPEQSGSPFTHPELTSEYILKWLQGARDFYGVEIDYMGIWNERASDATYAKTLRKTLDAANFSNTKLVAKDGGSDICDEMAKDEGYVDAISVVGLHYPSDYSDYSNCRALGYGLNGKRGGKKIWASEESSSYDDLNGGACWGRIITSHWVLQGMTSSIMWNLVGAYLHGTAWDASSLFTAQEPWSGNYNSMSPVWASAHVTQFTKAGWDLMEVGSGSGQLPGGGFYATYADPGGKDWTLTVVKIDEDHAPCTRPPLPSFNVTAENVTFKMAASMRAEELAVWYSNFEEVHPDGTPVALFQQLASIRPKDGEFTLEVKIGSFYTVSTILEGPRKGQPPTPVPKSQPMLPLPLRDDFEKYETSQEARWWSDQIGAFEVHFEKPNATSGNKVMRQMVPELPIGWSDHGSNGPMTLVGMREWQDITVAAAFKLPEGAGHAGCLGSRVDQMWQYGIVLCVKASGEFTLSVGGPKLGGSIAGQLYKNGTAAALPRGAFSRMSLTTLGKTASATLNGVQILKDVAIRDIDTGFAAIGANDWFPIEYDDVSIEQVGDRWTSKPSECPTAPRVGTLLAAAPCVPNGLTAADEGFELLSDWGLRHLASGLCASAASAEDGQSLTLAVCDPRDLRQQFKNDYTNVRNYAVPFYPKVSTGEKGGLVLTGRLDGAVSIGKPQGKLQGLWQTWSYFPNSKQLRNQYKADDPELGYPMCLTTCRSRTEEILI